MHINTDEDIELSKVWELLIQRLGVSAQEVCSNSSSFYKTQDGLECALRRRNGDLMYICYREKNRSSGYRWTIEKI